jgi:hypothetical protein
MVAATLRSHADPLNGRSDAGRRSASLRKRSSTPSGRREADGAEVVFGSLCCTVVQ